MLTAIFLVVGHCFFASLEGREEVLYMKRTLVQKLGLLGVVSLLSYTAAVVLLSIASLVVILVAGARDRGCRSYGVCAGVALGMMLTGALGMKLVPAAYFGVVERFSTISAVGFNAVLGVYLFKGFD